MASQQKWIDNVLLSIISLQGLVPVVKLFCVADVFNCESKQQQQQHSMNDHNILKVDFSFNKRASSSQV